MRTCRIVDFTVPAGHRRKLKEYEKRDKYYDLARELWNKKVTIILIVIGALGTVTKELVHFCIIEISQNTEKSPRDLRILVVTQPPVRNHQLSLV